MQPIKKILVILVSTLLTTCIEPYNTIIDSQNASKFVVFGEIADDPGYQVVSVSMSSPVNDPKEALVSGCTVKISDSKGNEFILTEFEKGNYRVWLDKEQLLAGTGYQLNIKTPTGLEIVSEVEKMPESVEIDTIYFIRKDIPTSSPSNPIQGIQFYVDLNAINTDCRFFRWDVEETWEHHAAYPILWYWNKTSIVKSDNPNWSKFYCWSTLKLQNVFILSTVGLVENRYQMQKLHFTDNRSQRLTYCYSIKVTQHSLTKTAYEYWNNVKKNNGRSGELYDTQPIHIKGNLTCTSDPELEILGFFTASPNVSKRIFVKDVKDLDLFYLECDAADIERGDLNKSRIRYLIWSPEDGKLKLLEDACVLCNANGGSTIKPSYWPN